MSLRNTSLWLLVVTSLLLSSCVLFNPNKPMTFPRSDQEFKEAMDWYGSIINDEKVSQKKKSRAHLKLGMLYSHYRNPALDYEEALNHVEASISMLNGTTPDDSVMNLRSLLKSITGIDISSLPALNRLNKENRALVQENSELRKTLKKLNELEVELERKRREIK